MRSTLKALFSLLLAAPLAAQTINPNQIRPSTSSNQVLTTVTANQPPVWAAGGGGGTYGAIPVMVWAGTQQVNSQLFAAHLFPSQVAPVTIPPGCTGSDLRSIGQTAGSPVAATNAIVFTYKDLTTATTLCSFSVAISGTVATVSGSGGTINSGDIAGWVGPATADPTFAYFSGAIGATAQGTGGGGGGGAVSSVSNSDGTLTVTPTTGAVVVSLALGNANTWTIGQAFHSGLNLSGTTAPLLLNGLAGTSGQVVTSTGPGSSPVWGLGSGGAVSLTSPGGTMTLTPNPITGTGTMDIALGHANAWTANQSFSGVTFTSITGVNPNCLQVNASGVAAGSGFPCQQGTISGQGNGVIPKATGATAITAQSALSDNGTTVSSTEPVAINDGTGNAGAFNSTAGTDPGGTSGIAKYLSDATNGYAEAHEGTGSLTRICTVLNGQCASLTGVLTTTASTSDNVTITGMTSSGHCSLTATDALAATNTATTYISAKTTNQITVTHTASSGLTYDILCTVN